MQSRLEKMVPCSNLCLFSAHFFVPLGLQHFFVCVVSKTLRWAGDCWLVYSDFCHNDNLFIKILSAALELPDLFIYFCILLQFAPILLKLWAEEDASETATLKISVHLSHLIFRYKLKTKEGSYGGVWFQTYLSVSSRWDWLHLSSANSQTAVPWDPQSQDTLLEDVRGRRSNSR